MMFYCTKCGAYLLENELETVTYDDGRREIGVCPDCFAELCNSLDMCGEEEENRELAIRQADEIFDRRRDG